MSFKFLYFPKLAKNVMALEKKELASHNIEVTEPHQLEREKLSTARLAQLSKLERLVIELRSNKALTRKEKEFVLTGAVLIEEENIKNSYKLLSPERSNLLQLLRKAVGITEHNVLDDESKNNAVDAYKKYREARNIFLNSIKVGHALQTSTMSVFERLAQHPKKIKTVMSKAHPEVAQVLADLPTFNRVNLHHVEVKEKHAELVKNVAHIVPKKAEKDENASQKSITNFFASFKNAIRHFRPQDEVVVEEKASVKLSK